MTYVSIFVLLLFVIVLCVTQIPKLVKQRLFRELAAYSVFLLYGAAITILAILGKKVPSPNDLWGWIYSPFAEFMKTLPKP